MLIEFVGIDGAGKTTQAKRLKRYLHLIFNEEVYIVHGYKPYKYTNELNKLCENSYKEDVFSVTVCSYLYLLDAMDTFLFSIEPLLKSGKIVITDKYISSSLVYAPILGCNKKIIETFITSFYSADLIIFLDVTPETAYERVLRRGDDLQKKESLDIMRQASKEFKNLCKRNKSIIIDANGSEKNVWNSIKKIIRDQL